jgi:hypothetical protein
LGILGRGIEDYLIISCLNGSVEFQVKRKQKEYEQLLRFRPVDGDVFIEKWRKNRNA